MTAQFDARPSPDQGLPTSRSAVLATAIALTLLAALPRVLYLDRLSFYADEETTAFAARSLAEGAGTVMPSGMPYRRAMPLTWLNAASVEIFGTEKEFSYRVPTAILATLTVPLLFLFGLRFLNPPTAFLGSLLLALSEWHLVYSRQARMYAGFMFFFLAASFAIWAWAERGRARDLVVAVLLAAVAIWFHELGLLLAVVAVVPLLFPSWTRVPRTGLLALAAAIVVAATVYLGYAEVAMIEPWTPLPVTTGEPVSREWLPEAITALSFWAVPLALLGAGLGIWAVYRAPSDNTTAGGLRTLALYAAAVGGGAAACAGLLHAAALAFLVLLLFHPVDRRTLARRAWLPGLLIVGIALIWVVGSVAQRGPVEGVKSLISYPFPFLATLGLSFPGVILFFIGACAWLAFRTPRAEEKALRACAIAALLIIAAVGFRRGYSMRFLLEAYPFLLLVAGAGIIATFAEIVRRSTWSNGRLTLLAASVVIVSGILGAHGLPQTLRVVTLRHGQPTDPRLHMYPFRPDHEGAGDFVRRAWSSDDVIIAEDPLEQQWYAGQADYWLRSFADSRAFLYQAPDGQLRDVYTNSILLDNEPTLDSLVNQVGGRVWLVTSGETYPNRSYYLDPWQQRWLDSLERARAPAFSGRDGRTNVFCLNC